MRDAILERVRNTYHLRHGHGIVEQSREAGALFNGDFSSSTTAGAEFVGSRLGLGVMDGLNGEVVSVKGTTWRVPESGIPVEVSPSEGIALGIAAPVGITFNPASSGTLPGSTWISLLLVQTLIVKPSKGMERGHVHRVILRGKT